MIKEELQEYIMRNSNIDFNYNGKRYGIERMPDNNGNYRIFFWEWYNESTADNSYADFSEFEMNAQIDGQSVIDILAKIDDADVF